MATPPNAAKFDQPMDPSDIADFQLTFSRGTTQAALLQPDEQVASYTLAVTAEAAAAGLTIREGGGYDMALVGDDLLFWLSIDEARQQDPMFGGAGVSLPIELTIVTTSTPQRRRQRTVVVTVANQ